MKVKIWRIVGAGLAVIAVLAVLLGVLFGIFIHKFDPDPPHMAFSKPVDALEAQRQDLAYFRALVAMDRSFPAAARSEAGRRITALADLDRPLSRQKLHVSLMQIMALADNGHTQLSAFPDDGAEVDVLPVRVTAFADGIYVMRGRSAYRDLLGDRVVAVDGQPIDAVMQKLESLRGGLAEFRLDKAAAYLCVQDLLYGLGISPAPDRSTWTLVTPGGATVTRMLAAYPVGNDEPFPDPPRWMSPEPLKGMAPDWVAYEPAHGGLPESLQRFDVLFRDIPVRPGSCVRYVRMRAISDDDGQAIQPFIAATEGEMHSHPPCAVVLDLRYNHGGSFTNTYGFMHSLPGLLRSGGHIYVLTEAMTFSAAITTAAFVVEAGGDKVSILGEPVGDRLAFFAEGGRGCLPNSKLCVDYATGKHDYAQPCTDWDTCFWLTWLYPVHVKTLAPDELIPDKFSAWDAGHDPAYERALQLADSSDK